MGTRSGDADAGAVEVVRDTARDSARREGAMRGKHTTEDLAIGRLRPGLLKVVQQRIADRGGQRVSGAVTGLAFRHANPLALPVDVVERQRRDFPAAKAIRDEQDEDRVVPSPGRATALNSVQHSTHLIPGDRARDAGETVASRHLDARAEVSSNQALSMKVPEENAEDARPIAQARRAEILRALRDEAAKDRRRDRAEGPNPNTLEIRLERPEVVLVVEDRCLLKPAFLDEVIKELARSTLERWTRPPRPSARGKSRNHEAQHLADRVPRFACDLVPRFLRLAISAALPSPLFDEGIQVSNEVFDPFRLPCASELAEPDENGDSAMNVPSGIPLLGEPAVVPLA